MSTLRNAVLAGLGLGLTVLMSAAAAVAANAYATADVNERAGPGTEYPVVTLIPAGATLTIFGCLTEVRWCDVGYAGVRGWVQGDYLQAFYESRRVPLVAYAPRIGIPIVSFSIVYWDDHYRRRPFYRDRARFVYRDQGHFVGLHGGRVIGPVGKGPRHIAGGGPKRFAKVAGPNRLRYAKYGKAPRPKLIRAQRTPIYTNAKAPKPKLIRAHRKPIYINAKAPRMVMKKPSLKKCVVRAGRRIC